jgi:undecaprenyl-diphosphatase
LNHSTNQTSIEPEDTRVSVTELLRHYWLPLLSFAVLAVACTDTNYYDGRRLARNFSGDWYKIFIVVSVVTLLLLAWQRRKLSGVRHIIELVLLSLVLTNILKFALPLGRPPRMHDGVIDVHSPYSPGFPSAHTAFSFGLAWLIFEFQPRLAPLWFAFAVAVGWSRIELFAHYPYQVLAGAVMGSALAYWISHAPRGVLFSLRDLRASHRADTASKNGPPG